MSKLFLGVDGGQSSTAALIADASGRVLGAGRGGPCNHIKSGDGVTKFRNAIEGCVRSAAREAGLATEKLEFAGAALGFSGGPDDKAELVRQMIRAERFVITNDGAIALAGATAGEPGMIVIAGTGSLAYGRNAAGRYGRAGGWGYVYGDEGGGFDIVREAVRACLRFEEGWGPRTSLFDAMLAATQSSSANEMMHRFYTDEFPRPRIAAFSALVDAEARAGDAVAAGILHQAAQQLAAFAGNLRQVLFAPDEPAVVCPVGSVYQSEMLRYRFAMLVGLNEANRVEEPVYSPAAGALILAWEAAGVKPSADDLPKAGK
jgi:N-acetylglucosamine kinase-like BadF-type ATPase